MLWIKKFVKNTNINTLKTKVNNLEKKISGETTLIHINQYNTDKQNFEYKLEMLIKIPGTNSLVTTTFLTQTLLKLRTKYRTLVN